MASYRSGSWAARKDALGDEAEGHFEERCKRIGLKYERFGLDHSELNVAHLPRRIRYMPDFLTNEVLFECIGCGSDQKLKLAIYKWNCLQYWDTVMPVQLYCWDRKYKRETTIALCSLNDLIDELKIGVGSFPEKKAYWAIPCKELTWESVA